MMRRALLGSMVLATPVTALAAATVHPLTVQSGICAMPDCEKTVQQNCLCEADISIPVVSGISETSARSINQRFKEQTNGHYGDDSFTPYCQGDPIQTKERASDNRHYKYTVVENNDERLVINTSYSHYKAGMAHPFGFDARYAFNPKTGEQLDARR